MKKNITIISKKYLKKQSHIKLFILMSIIALSLIFINNLNAYSIFDLGYGTEIPHHDARTAALGGAGVAGGFTYMDSNLNPANLYFLKDSKGAQINHSLIKNSENRAIPMYNFFDSYVGESTYARNEDFYSEVSMFMFYALNFGQNKLSVGFGFRPVVNFYADYKEDVRNDENSDSDNYPPIIAKNFIESEGYLDSYNVVLNWGIPAVSVGAEFSYLTGKHDYEKRIIWTDYAHEKVGTGVLNDYYFESSNKIDGVKMNFGLSSQINRRVRLAATYSPKANLKTDMTIDNQEITNSDDYILPSKMRFGLLFKPRNPFRTNFQLDIEFVNHSEVNKFYDNTYAFYVGMEHYVGRAIPFRLGFRHETAKQDKSITMPVISAGSGFPVLNKLHFDFSAEYGRREYQTLDLFMDGFYNYNALWRSIQPADRGWENPDKVTESFFKFYTSLTYRW